MNAPSAQPTITVGGFSIDILVQGYPGKTVCHGGSAGARSRWCAGRAG